MTATATRPDTEGAHDDEPMAVDADGILGTGDHKVVGLLFLGTGLLLLVVCLVAAAVVGFERLDPTSADLLTNDTDVLQVHALAQLGLPLLGVLPALLGLAIYLVPLQVGAPTLAFPRAAAMGLWAWLLGAIMQLASFGINGGPWGGEPDGVELWATSTMLLVVGLLLATACVVTTVITHRAPGMSLGRTPLFAWSVMVGGSIWLATLPVLLGDLLLIVVDHANGRLQFGLNTEIWGQVGWLVLAPTILMVTVPVLGIAGDVLPVHTGARQRFHAGMLTAIGGFGVLTFGAWYRPLLAESPDESVLYQGMAILLLLPVLLALGGWIDTVRQGRLRLTGPVLASLLAVLGLLDLAATSIAISLPQTELAGTTAHNGIAAAAVLVAVLGLIAALGHWSPKLFGRSVPDGAIKLGALLVTLGAVAVLGGELVAGLYDAGWLPVGPELRDAAEAMAPVVLGGWVAATLGVVVVSAALLTATLGSGEDAEDDPWGGHTLEWATSSPPPPGNFAAVPMVTSAAPLLDDRADEEEAS